MNDGDEYARRLAAQLEVKPEVHIHIHGNVNVEIQTFDGVIGKADLSKNQNQEVKPMKHSKQSRLFMVVLVVWVLFTAGFVLSGCATPTEPMTDAQIRQHAQMLDHATRQTVFFDGR